MRKRLVRKALTEAESEALTADLIAVADKYDLKPWEFGVSLATFILSLGDQAGMALVVIDEAMGGDDDQ